jgi:hypothetical protein
MYCPVLSWYKVVQGDTRWYMMVQGTVYGGAWRYMAVQESVKLYILVCTGTYLFLRFNLDPASLLQCCLAEGAVLKASAWNHSNASSSMFQSSIWACHRLCWHAAPGKASVAPPERGGPARAAAASAAAGPGGGAAASESVMLAICLGGVRNFAWQQFPRNCCHTIL